MSLAPTSNFTEQTGHKYTFQLELKKLHINPSLPFEVKIVWARGQNRIESQNPIKLQPPQNDVTLQECFCNKSTVLFNPKKFQFRKKQSRIQIILYANGSPKQGGEFVLNLCQILDPYNIKKQQQRVYKVVTRQQKPRCEIQFKLTAEYCQQMIRDQQRQAGSVVGSISSKNTTSLNPIMSGLEPKQYIQKKNLFLCTIYSIPIDQAPSKDNQSVTSYNSYSTNMMRYNSGKKERDDSVSMRKDETASMRKEEYGLSGRRETGGMINANSPTDMFTKTTSVNMKSLNSQFDARSKGGYNRVTMQQPFDNRTENYDPQINKQLQDEQSRRSKLQAEVSRLNIYVKEQSTKLTEYIQENTRLKEQLNRLNSDQQNTKPALEKQTAMLRQQFEEQFARMRQENDDLHNRAFSLNNQNRQLTRRYESTLEEKQRLEEEIRRTRTDKQRFQVSIKQSQSLRDELQHIKSLNLTLRQSLDKQRRKLEQLQYSNTYQKSAIEESTKKKQQRLYELQRENSLLMGQIKDRERELQTKKQLIYRLEKSSTEYKDKIIVAEGDKNRMLEENGGLRLELDKVKRQLFSMRDNATKVRDQKTAEYQQRNTQLQNLNYQSQQKIRSLEFQLDQSKKNQSQTLLLNQTLKKDLEDKKNEIYRLENNVRCLKQIESKFYSVQKTQTQKQRQILASKQQNNRLLYRISELEDQNRKMMVELEESRKKSRNVPNVDVNQILRESVQMQVELKFKTDQLLRLKGIQEKHEQLLYKLQTQERNRKQTEEQAERLEKQVKDKNKLYLIEVEKGKLILREKAEIQKILDQMKIQLKRCQDIIFNGDRQVKDMETHINFLQSENLTMRDRLNAIDGQVNLLRNRVGDVVRLENAVKDLERQCQQKTQAASILNSNLSNAQKRIQQLQNLSNTRQSQAQQAIRTAQSSSQKLIELESTQSSLSQHLHQSLHEKRSLQMKCETVMQQLHSLKKQFEQEKVRSTSVVSMRSSEDQVRIRQMQNQLQKKEKIISKLTKEKLEIEEENINLHVQVMKKLSQMEKSKDISITQGQ